MKMYIPFGDWSDDGHGKYRTILVDAPSMEHLLTAQDRIRDQYGKSFFDQFADQYNKPCFGEAVWDALIATEYPIDRMIELEDTNDWDGCKNIKEVLEIDNNPWVSLEFVIDAFIWLLNAHGAQITRLDAKDDIPMICNWTCRGFETVGYGCFYE